MSVLRNKPDSASSEASYTFLKPMPSSRSDANDSPSVVTNRQDPSQVLFPPRGVAPRTLNSGVLLGPYRIEEEIGRGGMGAVFRASDTRLDRVVALKVLGADLSRDKASVTRFQNEARAAARLDHESIARVHDVGHDHGLYYIAFEFVPGNNLREVLARNSGPLSFEQAIGFTLQIADALNQTTSAGVVHRDIKPSNIILTPSGRAKLVDWGLARQNGLDLSQDLTQAGTTLGTFDYISPEQAVDPRNVDIRSDIYSLGCTLFHMLTGEPPYPRGSMFQKVLDHHRTEPPSASSRNPDIPDELSQVVRKMMASDPAQRYESPQALIDELSDVAAELGLRPLTPVSGFWSAPTSTPVRERVKAGWGWLGAFVALIALVWSVDRSSSQRWTFDPPPTPPVTPSDSLATNTSREKMIAPDAPEEGILRGASQPPVGRMHLDAARLRDDMLARTPLEKPEPSKELIPTAPEAPDAPEPMPMPMPSSTNPVAPPQHFVVQSVLNQTSERFPSLEAACASAQHGDTIEIDVDGPLPPVLRPLRIVNKRLIVKAAAGRRPQLQFGPYEPDLQHSPLESHRLLSLSGGDLTLRDVALILRTGEVGSTGRCSLFALTNSSRLNLQSVSVTIDNQDRHLVAIVEAATSASPNVNRSMNEMTGERGQELQIDSSIIRGRADLIWHPGTEPVTSRITQSAVALNGAFYRHTGGGVSSSMTGVRIPSTLELDYVTAVVDRSLVRIELGDQNDTQPLDVICRNSLIRVPEPSQPLVAMSGNGDPDEYDHFMTWNGRNNVFDLKSFACEILTGGLSGPMVRSLTLEEWTLHRTSENEVQASNLFQKNDIWNSTNFADSTLDAFQLRTEGQNPAIQGSESRQNVGVDLTQPALPRSLPLSGRRDSAILPSFTTPF